MIGFGVFFLTQCCFINYFYKQSIQGCLVHKIHIPNFTVSLQVECGPRTLKDALIFHNHNYLCANVVLVLSWHMDPLTNFFFFFVPCLAVLCSFYPKEKMARKSKVWLAE